jgi:glycosyl-4,4'-diaponeurosporenoate acyltransferase
MIGNLSSPWMLFIDFAAWLCINLGVARAVSLLPRDSFNPRSWLYREREWEKKPRAYERLFRVKRWKGWLPEGAAVSRNAFRKRHLVNSDPVYLEMFVQETCRAELLHWIIFFFCPLFFIWNPWYAGLLIVVYAAVANLPCVIAQRYNRMRLNRVLDAVPRSEGKAGS